MRMASVFLFAVLCPSLILSGLFTGIDAHAAERRTAVVDAVEKVGPAVVNISTVTKERVASPFPFSQGEFFRDFFPDLFLREYMRTSLGSGVIIDGKEGYIVTNHHVVAGATEVTVITADRKVYEARVLGSDPRSDLAVLQVRADGPLPEIPMGNSNDLMIGETLIAIGNPFGLSHSVTTGVVSALDRSVRSEEYIHRHFIQTDASINPGNSGGPLLNINGELIGINTAIYQKAQGIGFAIPVNKARRIVKELIRAGMVRIPWLGLGVQELTSELKAYFKLPEEKSGLLIREIMEGGPADLAGLKRGDVLTALEDMTVSSPRDYQEALGEFTPGQEFPVSILRKGREQTRGIRGAVFPEERTLSFVYRRLGIRVEDLRETVREKHGIKGGIGVTEVNPDSEAARVGIRPGDVIRKVNAVTILSLDDLKKAVSLYHHHHTLSLIVQRGPYGYSLTLPF